MITIELTVLAGEATPLVPPAMGGVLIASERADSSIDMRETAATYGIALTSVDAFARQFFGARNFTKGKSICPPVIIID